MASIDLNLGRRFLDFKIGVFIYGGCGGRALIQDVALKELSSELSVIGCLTPRIRTGK
jgi:hypothetical protein